ncbi:MAG: hypothetical protein AB7V25_15010 [Mangrovibacterium sp.]
MKEKFNLLLLFCLLVPFLAHAADYDKKIHRDFPESQISALNITNKFGTIEIRDSGGNLVTVDATVTVRDANESRAQALLNKINIEIGKNGSVLEVTTVIEENFNTKGNFSIDYKINIPKNKDLTVNNKFGNLVMADLGGKGNFTIAYGNLTAGSLNPPADAPVWLDLSYGKADIGSASRMNGLIKYSKLFMESGGTMELETKYSGLNIRKMENMKLESKYDGVDIGEAGAITANSKYTNYGLEKLNHSLSLQTGYGSVRIDQVSPGFSTIRITNSYGGITIGLGTQDYQLDAECEYCDIKYPADRFKGNRARENQSVRVNGQIGGTTPGKQVMIRSRYGGINLLK